MEHNALELVAWNLQSWKLTLALVQVFKVGSIWVHEAYRVESKYMHDVSTVTVFKLTFKFKLEYSKAPDINIST